LYKKELVQNAEDAGASSFKVMLCAEDNMGSGDYHPMYRKIFQVNKVNYAI
jgi:ferric iron reductase protein FhuF